MDKWASDIWSRHDAYVPKGVAALGLPPNWSCNVDKLDMFAPLKLGYTGTEWSSARLGRICAAMQLWEGKARKEDLDAGRLKSHRQNVNARKRWKSLDILFAVANLLRHQGTAGKRAPGNSRRVAGQGGCAEGARVEEGGADQNKGRSVADEKEIS
jgi:hypothetical protein